MARYLITSALPYVNNRPHLGHLIGCILPADIYTRFLKLKGHEAIYICGTDEHGTASELAAKQAGVPVQEWCDKMHALHKQDYEWFGIDFTRFGRTSSKTNHEMTQYIFKKLWDRGYIFERETEQLYCEHCKMFLPDRYVIGTCPYCGKETHAGQCENCGKLLEPAELQNAKCVICGSTPMIQKTKHLYLDLPKFKDQLKEWIEGNKHWPANARNWALSLLENLQPRCITRDLKWGVKVPLPGYEDKVFYVWFDAPIGYISITKEWADEAGQNWEKWWKDKETQLIHFIGKDNIPFHTIIFPSMLMGTREFILPYNVYSMEFLNYEGMKFSKSKGVGVFLFDARDMPYPPDYWRFALVWMAPEARDTDFTWDEFARAINELADTYGNLVNRVLVLSRKFFGSEVPEPGEFSEDDKKLISMIESSPDVVEGELEKPHFREALKRALDIAREANAYLNAEEPWKEEKSDRRGTVVFLALNAVKSVSILLNPFIPNITREVLGRLGVDGISWADAGKVDLAPGTKLGDPVILVRKIRDEEVEKWRGHFMGMGQKQEAGKEGKEGKKVEKVESEVKRLPGLPGVSTIQYSDFKKLDIRVARIVKAEEVPGSDKLIRLELDVGDLGKRQVVAGIKKWYKPEELEGKLIVLLANLEPKRIFGMESQGMILAAEDGGNISLLAPEKDVRPGAKVM